MLSSTEINNNNNNNNNSSNNQKNKNQQETTIPIPFNHGEKFLNENSSSSSSLVKYKIDQPQREVYTASMFPPYEDGLELRAAGFLSPSSSISNFSEDSQNYKGVLAPLPDHVMVHVFSFLTASDLCFRVETVCKHWRKVSLCDYLWRGLYEVDKQWFVFRRRRKRNRYTDDDNNNGDNDNDDDDEDSEDEMDSIENSEEIFFISSDSEEEDEDSEDEDSEDEDSEDEDEELLNQQNRNSNNIIDRGEEYLIDIAGEQNHFNNNNNNNSNDIINDTNNSNSLTHNNNRIISSSKSTSIQLRPKSNKWKRKYRREHTSFFGPALSLIKQSIGFRHLLFYYPEQTPNHTDERTGALHRLLAPPRRIQIVLDRSPHLKQLFEEKQAVLSEKLSFLGSLKWFIVAFTISLALMLTTETVYPSFFEYPYIHYPLSYLGSISLQSWTFGLALFGAFDIIDIFSMDSSRSERHSRWKPGVWKTLRRVVRGIVVELLFRYVLICVVMLSILGFNIIIDACAWSLSLGAVRILVQNRFWNSWQKTIATLFFASTAVIFFYNYNLFYLFFERCLVPLFHYFTAYRYTEVFYGSDMSQTLFISAMVLLMLPFAPAQISTAAVGKYSSGTPTYWLQAVNTLAITHYMNHHVLLFGLGSVISLRVLLEIAGVWAGCSVAALRVYVTRHYGRLELPL